MNAELKLAKVHDRAEMRRQLMELARHPVYSLLAAFVLIEALQQVQLKSGEAFMARTGTVLQGALITKEALNMLANSGLLEAALPAITKALVK